MTTIKPDHLPTIVYVEDNIGDATLLEEAVRVTGHSLRLLVIDKGDNALRYFEIKVSARDVPPPHCILLDAHLPAVTGAQLLRYVRTHPIFDRTPVYIFASMAEYQDLLDDGLIPPRNFLTKPSSWQGFLQLANLMARSAEESMDRNE
jgi:CheY-like chemotaxis protein